MLGRPEPTMTFPRLASALSLVALAVAVGACKKDPPPAPAAEAGAGQGRPGVVASCDMTAIVGSCNEWAKLSMGMEKGLCDGLKGKFAEGAAAGCPTANEIGRCAMADGEVRHYYGVAVGTQGFTAADAEKDCATPEIAGKFTAVAP